MSVARYRKRPGEVEAIQWTGDNFSELTDWAGECIADHWGPDYWHGFLRLYVEVSDEWQTVSVGDWAAKGKHGFCPIEADVFTETYERVEETVPAIEEPR